MTCHILYLQAQVNAMLNIRYGACVPDIYGFLATFPFI